MPCKKRIMRKINKQTGFHQVLQNRKRELKDYTGKQNAKTSNIEMK